MSQADLGWVAETYRRAFPDVHRVQALCRRTWTSFFRRVASEPAYRILVARRGKVPVGFAVLLLDPSRVIDDDSLWLLPESWCDMLRDALCHPGRMIRAALASGKRALRRFHHCRAEAGEPRSAERYWWLQILAVDDRFQGDGVGGLLVRFMLQGKRAAGVPCLRLNVLKENARAIGFYEKCGFQRTGESRAFYVYTH